jgi:hypothetical protein
MGGDIRGEVELERTKGEERNRRTESGLKWLWRQIVVAKLTWITPISAVWRASRGAHELNVSRGQEQS